MLADKEWINNLKDTFNGAKDCAANEFKSVTNEIDEAFDNIGSETLYVKYLDGAARMEMTEVGDWCDMFCYEDTTLKKGERTYISQGFAMKLPNNYEAIIAPRSSTFKRWGILQTNGIGKLY